LVERFGYPSEKASQLVQPFVLEGDSELPTLVEDRIRLSGRNPPALHDLRRENQPMSRALASAEKQDQLVPQAFPEIPGVRLPIRIPDRGDQEAAFDQHQYELSSKLETNP
jgi:hypothetical protein